jgi:DNA invertase Pin-like site-specific DNA recombinase
MLRAGTAEALLVTKLDRLTRRVVHLCELVDKYFASGRFGLMSVSEQVDTRTAAGRLVLNVLASVSQWEREAIGERTKAAMQHMRKTGAYTGGRAPYGYRLDGDELVADEAEQAVVAEARSLAASNLSLRAIADELARAGRLSRTGQVFTAKTVRAMVAA